MGLLLSLASHSPGESFLAQDREEGQASHECEGKDRLEGDVTSGGRQFVEGGAGTDEEK